MSAFIHRRRRAIVWLSIAAALLLGVGAQLHALSHSLRAVQASAHHDPLAAHTQACEQCLLFAALDGAAPTCDATPLPPTSEATGGTAPAARLAASSFTAYISRAPPRFG